MPTLKFPVLNRWTGAIQFAAEIDCVESDLPRVKLGLAVKWAYRSGAVLSDADLSGADLSDADLSGADLSGAVLSDADLSGADLSGAVLSDADLSDAEIIFAGLDARGYEFYLTANKAARAIVIRAGCRRWTSFESARAHFATGYTSNGDVPEILAKLALLETVALARGYLPIVEPVAV